jgi:hypothetical protein
MQLTPKSQKGSWQENCTEALLNYAAKAKGGAEEWREYKLQLERKKRVIIADANFDSASLRGFDLSRCYIVRVSFDRADLGTCTFRQAILRDTSLAHCNIEGSDFSHADVSSANFYGVRHNAKTKLNMASTLSDKNHARPAFRQAVELERYIADITSTANLPLKIWNWLTKYGNSVWRVLFASIVLNILFALIYYTIGELWQDAFKPASRHSYLEYLAASLQRFLNMSSTIETGHLIISYLFILNAFLGLSALGILIAIISKKLIVAVK